MKQLFLSILIILAFVFCVNAQQSRKVTVTLKNGDAVEGKFVSADALNISVGVGSQNIVLSWNDINSLQFADSKPVSTSPQSENAETTEQVRTATPLSSIFFIGNVSTKEFYSKDCAEVDEIYKNDLARFISEEAAEKSGFTKSSNCTLKTDSSTLSAPSTNTNLPALKNNGPVQVRGYTRKDGTYVRPHTRSLPGSRKP